MMNIKAKMIMGAVAATLSVMSAVSYADQSIVIRNRVDMPESMSVFSWPTVSLLAYDGNPGVPCDAAIVESHAAGNNAYVELRSSFMGGTSKCRHIDRVEYIVGGANAGALSAWFESGVTGEIKIPAGAQSASYSISDLPAQGGGQMPGDNGSPKGKIVVFNTSS